MRGWRFWSLSSARAVYFTLLNWNQRAGATFIFILFLGSVGRVTCPTDEASICPTDLSQFDAIRSTSSLEPFRVVVTSVPTHSIFRLGLSNSNPKLRIKEWQMGFFNFWVLSVIMASCPELNLKSNFYPLYHSFLFNSNSSFFFKAKKVLSRSWNKKTHLLPEVEVDWWATVRVVIVIHRLPQHVQHPHVDGTELRLHR